MTTSLSPSMQATTFATLSSPPRLKTSWKPTVKFNESFEKTDWYWANKEWLERVTTSA